MKKIRANNKARGKSKFQVKTLQFWVILIVLLKWICRNIEIRMNKQNFCSKLKNMPVNLQNKIIFIKNLRLTILDKAASMITLTIKCLCQNEKRI